MTTIADEYRAIEWEQGACHGLPTEWWFPERGRQIMIPVAVAICRGCPIQQECLDWALKHERTGIWGGLPERRRQKIRRMQHIRYQSPEKWDDFKAPNRQH